MTGTMPGTGNVSLSDYGQSVRDLIQTCCFEIHEAYAGTCNGSVCLKKQLSAFAHATGALPACKPCSADDMSLVLVWSCEECSECSVGLRRT